MPGAQVQRLLLACNKGCICVCIACANGVEVPFTSVMICVNRRLEASPCSSEGSRQQCQSQVSSIVTQSRLLRICDRSIGTSLARNGDSQCAATFCKCGSQIAVFAVASVGGLPRVIHVYIVET